MCSFSVRYGRKYRDINVGGVLTQKNQKKPVATPKSVNWHRFFFGFFWFFLVFLNFQIGIGFFWFFLVFFGIGFGQNSKLETGFFWFLLVFLVFFGFFWLFLVFFGIGLGQHSKLETGFLGSVGFFWYLNLGLEYHPKKYQKIPKKNQKNPKKTSRYTKIGKLAWFFFVFFGFFWGEHPPPNVTSI